jgi:hypothetical protein
MVNGCLRVSTTDSVSVRFVFVERARVNVGAKGREVNSVFLVQLRKMFATDFRGLTLIATLVEDVRLSRTEGLGSGGRSW